MREVAALAGVSLATVSRVLSGDDKVAPDRAERVRDAVALLGYRRDASASNLRRADRVSASIGVVFEDVANPGVVVASLLKGRAVLNSRFGEGTRGIDRVRPAEDAGR